MRALFFINYMKLFCSWQVVQHVCVFVSIVRRAHNTHQINWEIKYVNEREKKIAREKRYILFLLRAFFLSSTSSHLFLIADYSNPSEYTIIHIHKWNRWLLLRMVSVLFSIVIETNSRKIRVCMWVGTIYKYCTANHKTNRNCLNVLAVWLAMVLRIFTSSFFVVLVLEILTKWLHQQ